MNSNERRYTRDHHWAQRHPSGVRVGLTDFAQEELGEITFVQLPDVGTRIQRGDAACAIDALKAATELYAPVGGIVTAVNERLREPGAGRLINDDAEGSGWIFELDLEDDAEFDNLLSGDDYRDLVTPAKRAEGSD
jgi:glycine cleavage system H protein